MKTWRGGGQTFLPRLSSVTCASIVRPNGVIENNHGGRERNVLTSFPCVMMWEGFYSATTLRGRRKKKKRKKRNWFPRPVSWGRGCIRNRLPPSAAERSVWNAWRAAFKGNAQCDRQPDPGSAGLKSRDAKVNNSPANGGQLTALSVGSEPEKRSEVICLDY